MNRIQLQLLGLKLQRIGIELQIHASQPAPDEEAHAIGYLDAEEFTRTLREIADQLDPWDHGGEG